jgi:hypothetical protein
MSKVVKLTQSDIENIVTNIVNEQETGTYQLPDGEITYDTPEDKDYSSELDEVEFLGSDEDEPTGDVATEEPPMSEPTTNEPTTDDSETDDAAKVALGIGQDGFLYAIDPKTMSVVSKIKI